MLKQIKFEVNGQVLQLSALSALDYLEYIEYMNSLEKPDPIKAEDTEKEINAKLNKMTRNNLLAHARLIAFSLSHSQTDKTIEELQKEVLTTLTNSDFYLVLEAVQNVCNFPKSEGRKETESADDEVKNV
jgi:bacteriophage lambda minor tail protein (gpG)|nr:MAG TPA: tail assembly chaperone [Caudoviricetes sp.]